MIIDFTVKNFRSIKNEQTISLLSTLPKEDPVNSFIVKGKKGPFHLLRTASIYGANAAGKSNIIRAMMALRFLVLASSDFKVNEPIPCYEPFLLDSKSKNSHITFEVNFIVPDSNNQYSYLVAFNHKEIVAEKLDIYNSAKTTNLFSREKGKSMEFSNFLKGRKQSIANELLPNNLFLSKAVNSNQKQLAEVYLYFAGMISIVDSTYNQRGYGKTKSLSKNYSRQIFDIMRAFDFGLDGIRLEKRDVDLKFPSNMPLSVQKKIEEEEEEEESLKIISQHYIYDDNNKKRLEEWDFHKYESTGTKNLYKLAGYIVETLNKGMVLCVDELDYGLHPHMVEGIVNLFNSNDTNPKNAQLLLTSHNIELMSPEYQRRDQVWFMQKDKHGQSELYSLDEFDKNAVRKNSNYDKMYSEGRFNAIPRIDYGLIMKEN